MSQPSTADNTMTSEEHDQEVEEYIWSLMGRSGLLSEMKSQIAQFVQNNGKTKEKFSVDVSRIHPAILSMIYEYLKWVGMKNTCALLLCESPVQFETTTISETPNGNPSPVPELCTYLSEKLAQAEKSRLTSAMNQINQMNQTFLVSGSPSTAPSQIGIGQSNQASSKTSPPPSQIPTPFGNNQSHNSSQGNKGHSSQGQPSEIKGSTNNHVNHSTPSSRGNSLASDSSESESVSKSGPREKDVYTKQYEKSVNDLKKNQSGQKLEMELKPSNSDQSLQQKPNKEHMHYVFMTEKQKMEALNKKFSGSDLFTKKKSSDEPITSPTSDNGSKQEKSEKVSQISNPWKKPNSTEPDFEDESISDLNDSTAEDVTQDLSMDSDSKMFAANVAECEHLMKLK